MPLDGFNQIYNFTESTSYNKSTGTQVADGVGKLLAVTPANAKLGISFVSDSKDANWTDDTDLTGPTDSRLTGTLIGGAVVTAGKLVCTGNVNKACYYENNAIANVVSLITIKLKYTPNYTTSPANNTNVISLVENATNRNKIVLFVSPSGNNLRLSIWDELGNVVLTAGVYGSFTPTAGTEYELLFTVNTTAGTSNAYVNGVKLTTLNYTPFTRTATANRLYVGASPVTYTVCNASYDDIMLFNNIQVTENYTPGYSVLETPLLKTNPTIEPNGGMFSDQLSSMVATIIKSGSDDVRISHKFDGVQMWYNTSTMQWETNGNDYAKTNTAIELTDEVIQAAVFSMLAKPVWWFHSENGYTTPQIDLSEYVYLYNPSNVDIEKVLVYGTLTTLDGNLLANTKVTARYAKSYPTVEVTNQNIVIPSAIVERTTNEDGEFMFLFINGFNITFSYYVGEKMFEDTRTVNITGEIEEYKNLPKWP